MTDTVHTVSRDWREQDTDAGKLYSVSILSPYTRQRQYYSGTNGITVIFTPYLLVTMSRAEEIVKAICTGNAIRPEFPFKEIYIGRHSTYKPYTLHEIVKSVHNPYCEGG